MRPKTTRFTIICLALALGLTAIPASASTVSLSVDQSPVQPGVPFWLNVEIDEGADVYAALFDLVYDGGFFELVDANPALSGVQPVLEIGPLLAPDGQTAPLFAAGRDEGLPGQAVLAVSRHSQPAGITFAAPTRLLRLQLRAKETGSSRIDFTANALRDSANQTIPGTAWIGLEIFSTTGENTPPTQPVVAIAPALPMTNQNLVCNIVTPSFDADGDPITYSYAWFRNGAPTGITVNTVSSANTLALEVWLCRVTPSDGKEAGPAGVASVTVGYVGDLNRDFVLDRRDLFELSYSWNREAPDPLLNPLADLNQDGRCDAADLAVFWDEMLLGPRP